LDRNNNSYSEKNKNLNKMRKNVIKASIIIPTYNRANFIEETIKSVLSQTMKNLEVIIVDDGSTDGTKEIIKNLATNDDRIKYLYQENCGRPSVPRNIGFKNSTGEYISFLDSDDIWLPQKLEKQIELFEKDKSGKLGFVDCKYIIIGENSEEIKQNYSSHGYRGNILKQMLKDHLIITPGSVLIKRSIINTVGLLDERLKCLDDWDMWLRISKHYKIDFVNKKLFKYRVHKNSFTVNLSMDNKRHDVVLIFGKNIENYRLYSPQNMKKCGVFCCENGDMENGRKFLKEAIKINLKDYGALFYYILSIFGGNFYNFSFSIIKYIYKMKNRVSKKKFNRGYDYTVRQKIFMDILNMEV
jgi:glycosyltransferase involved in cell wall biosynthesis